MLLGSAVDIWTRAQFTEIKRPGINIIHYNRCFLNLLSHLNILPLYPVLVLGVGIDLM